MRLLRTKALSLARKWHRPQPTRRQILKALGGVAAIYLIISATLAAVLWFQTNSSQSKTAGVRKSLDGLSFNLNLGTRILTKDLTDHQAIGRVGEYYLTYERFDQLAKSDRKRRRGKQISERRALERVDAVVDRMLIERLVGRFAQENNLKAEPELIENIIAANAKKQGGIPQLEQVLDQTYGWSLRDFRDEIEFGVLKAKMEESLGGKKFGESAKAGFQNADAPKVRAYADAYARGHNNYLITGGYPTLAKHYLKL